MRLGRVELLRTVGGSGSKKQLFVVGLVVLLDQTMRVSSYLPKVLQFDEILHDVFHEEHEHFALVHYFSQLYFLCPELQLLLLLLVLPVLPWVLVFG